MNISNISDYLKTLDGEQLYYCPNPGNGGDSLIAYAGFQLLKKNNLKYNFFNGRNFNPKGKTLIYGGGGNLVNNHHGYARRITENYHSVVKKLVILPHTISTHEDLLQSMGSNVDIICREKISYQHVKKYATKANVMLMNDLAFSLDLEDVFLLKSELAIPQGIVLKTFCKLVKDERQHQIPSPRKILRGWNLERKYRAKESILHENFDILNCFRVDAEKTDIEIPPENIDLSMEFAYGTWSEKISGLAAHKLLNFMNKFHEIRTNRLHLAIGGALLGKKVKFYSNNYYKCQAIYEYSMKDIFKNVEWMG